MSFGNLTGYILSILVCMQNVITIFFTTSTVKKYQFAISWARSCQYQCLCISLLKYSTQFKRSGHYHFFRIWHSAKPRRTINVILQFLGLDLFSMKLSAKFYQNIPNGLRVKFHKGHFHFFRIWSSAKPRTTKNDIS